MPIGEASVEEGLRLQPAQQACFNVITIRVFHGLRICIQDQYLGQIQSYFQQVQSHLISVLYFIPVASLMGLAIPTYRL